MGNTLKTTLLLAVLTVLFVLVGNAIGGQSGMVFAFGLAIVMNVGSYWFSDKIVLRMYKAREVTEAESPQLHGMVHRLALSAGVPMPKVYIIPEESPNAFATGRDPAHAAVAATEGILRVLSPDELEGVLAHEMAHVKNRDILIGTVAATLAGAIMMLASMARFAAIFGGGRDDREGGGGLQLLVMAILAPLGAMMIQMAVSRSREYLADETGARFCGKPEALARALEKISNGSRQVPMQASPATAHMFIMSPLTGGGLMSLFSTHPPVEKRIERLMAMRGQTLR
ncbi:MAG: zinc metalloprotease HtpX [Deltaproteobacteria bacterium]|uniref:zinc metalloprotease HtpX n=1 Tax=Candidatus Deferrimicrobium sp. TaxID=3060586 RepID=UPI00271B11CE|nr:zinc metalloprotease HtpX [Candidatus Deferrimicrobium sp.]MCR4309265.1 zinc metalloprotease HtpX [Deltaproteobacteria bacterium]MDO8739612.1 zinc metalloprotease HtpX [Candidatus Deferrimicrobium sp.]